MKKHSFALLSVLSICAGVTFSPVTQADETQSISSKEQELNMREQELNKREQALEQREQSYGDKVGEKALNGFTNINTAILEIPKNIINTSNESNIAYGFIGGTTKGILNTVGRMMSGLTDLVTAPIITKPIVQPYYVWDNFDADSTYGPVFRLDNEPDPIAETGARNVTNETAIKVAPVNNSANRAATNRELDRRYKEEMMK